MPFYKAIHIELAEFSLGRKGATVRSPLLSIVEQRGETKLSSATTNKCSSLIAARGRWNTCEGGMAGSEST